MAKEITVIFPNQLFRKNPAISKDREILLVEEPRYFTDFKFHKQKIILHRASMKAYEDFLKKKGYKVTYVPFSKDWKAFCTERIVHMVRPYDHKLEKTLPTDIEMYPSPGFLNSKLEKKKRYFMANFYKKQRRRLQVLMDGPEPVGGKWSHDLENRKKLPKEITIPPIGTEEKTYVTEAKEYVKKHFPNNPGSDASFIYPTTHAQSSKWLDRFIEERLENFGLYQDSIDTKEPFLFHSVISPMLNIGLLTPAQVLESVRSVKVPINAKEGFIRQIIGWREFVLQVYLLEGETQRRGNHFKHKKKLPKGMYDGKTEMEPVNAAIQRAQEYAYTHHIERLMVLGNYLLLKEVDPNEVYRWFMELFIDSYDWVMVPNVYGMSQYADGGLMTTKPYFSSSNYIRKMSNYKKGDWCEKWDTLFWNFMKKHKEEFSKNPRLNMLIKRIN